MITRLNGTGIRAAYSDETHSAVNCLSKLMTGECMHNIVGDVFVEVVVEYGKNIVDKKLETM